MSNPRSIDETGGTRRSLGIEVHRILSLTASGSLCVDPTGTPLPATQPGALYALTCDQEMLYVRCVARGRYLAMRPLSWEEVVAAARTWLN